MENPPSATIEKHASGDHRKWTLWHYVNERNKSLDACQHQVGSFDTLEGFWSAYYAVPPPCKIRMGDAYSLFKNGIRPTREDDTNKNGGRWELKQNKYFRSRDVDNVWLAVVKFIMGDDFASLEDICGAVVNIRARGHKISIWTLNTDEERMMKIGRAMRQSLNVNIPSDVQIHFYVHADQMPKNRPVCYST